MDSLSLKFKLKRLNASQKGFAVQCCVYETDTLHKMNKVWDFQVGNEITNHQPHPFPSPVQCGNITSIMTRPWEWPYWSREQSSRKLISVGFARKVICTPSPSEYGNIMLMMTRLWEWPYWGWGSEWMLSRWAVSLFTGPIPPTTNLI